MNYSLIKDATTGSSVHPSLYPLLLFLSKMRAPLTAEDLPPPTEPIIRDHSTSDLNPLLFLPLLEKCLSASVYQVRSMAARGFDFLQNKIVQVLH